MLSIHNDIKWITNIYDSTWRNCIQNDERRCFKVVFANTIEFERISIIFDFARVSWKLYISRPYKWTYGIQNDDRSRFNTSIVHLQRYWWMTNNYDSTSRKCIQNDERRIRSIQFDWLSRLSQFYWPRTEPYDSVCKTLNWSVRLSLYDDKLSRSTQYDWWQMFRSIQFDWRTELVDSARLTTNWAVRLNSIEDELSGLTQCDWRRTEPFDPICKTTN